MSHLDADLLRESIREDARPLLDKLEVFSELDSTNTYLMQMPAPPVGRCRVATADTQTAGRGRRGRRWISLEDSGLCMSLAYTFGRHPESLPALTLAVGIGVIDVLQSFDVGGVFLKWPNDLVLKDSKLGGILTELKHARGSMLTIVTGIGINVALPSDCEIPVSSDWASGATDLSTVLTTVPRRELLAARIIESLSQVLRAFELHGFRHFIERWPACDWLYGKAIEVSTNAHRVKGVAAGVDGDGALLVETESGITRVITGTIFVSGVSAARR